MRSPLLLSLIALAGCRPWYLTYGIASEAEARTAAAIPKLIRALESDDLDHAREASRALAAIGAPAVPALAAELRGGRHAAAWALGELGPAAAPAVPELTAALGHRDKHLRTGAVRALAAIGPPAAAAEAALRAALLADREDDVRREIPSALVAIRAGSSETLAALEQAASRDKGFRVRRAAREARDTLRFQALAGGGRDAGARRAVSRPAAAPRPILAVFELEDGGGVLATGARTELGDYLATQLVELARYRVVPRAQLRARLVAEKTGGYRPCYDEACQIELGRALAAQKSVAPRLVKLGARCTLTAKLYDLRSETAERAASVETDCDPARLLEAARQVALKLR